MKCFRLMVVCFSVFFSSNIFAQVADDIFEGKIITKITNYKAAITIEVDGVIDNPDNCEVTSAYLVTFSGRRTQEYGNTNHGGDRALPVDISLQDLSRLRENSTPVNYRLEGCMFGFPVVRWISY